MFAIRGAIRVQSNERSEIYHDTQRLLDEIVRRNGLDRSRIVSAFFTMTPDLNADFPAYAAREMGWIDVPMLGAQETAVPGALDRMVRVLVHVEGEGPGRHVYLGDAAAMRPDLADPEAEGAEASLPAEPEFGPFLVVGLGLIGGSVALAVRRSGLFADVRGWDLDPEARKLAVRAGAISADESDLAPALERAEVVLLALPVTAALDWVEEVGPSLRDGTVLVDVASTKRSLIGAMDALPPHVEAVGAHPMAGSELSGMGAARPDLFFGSTWALVASRRTGDRAREAVRAILGAVGAEPFWTEAERHDRATAATSHLPYLLAAALARHVGDFGDEEAALALAGPGLRDMTRLAASRPQVMADILRTNWAYVRDEVRRFQEGLGGFVGRLEDQLSGDLRPVLEAAAQARRRITKPRPEG
ncbi:MAG: chorismate mutase [Gemmatimonadota bacterium]